jgi:hypothetical protein
MLLIQSKFVPFLKDDIVSYDHALARIGASYRVARIAGLASNKKAPNYFDAQI